MFMPKLRHHLLFKSLSLSRKMTTIASLQRISPQALKDKVLSSDASLAIIDVRDDDYIGGHIRSSTNMPSRHLDAMMPTLIRRLREKKLVVFHCALSQIRGPSAALRYLRERDPALEATQTVCVLDGGFTQWQEHYGADDTLTEGYRPELWVEE